MTLLIARNIKKRFGGLQALTTLDVTVEPKSIHSVIGPNGAGKTTFFNCLTGFYKPEEGEILFEGRAIQGMPPDRVASRGISRTYQNIRLFSNVTVLENVLVGMHRHLHTGWFGAVIRPPTVRREEVAANDEAMRILKFVDLDKKADFVAKNLPYGEQRRLEIARALASKPTLILLDEPTAGMNPKETEDTTDLIRRLRDDLGITVLLIEHDMKVVMNISDLITVLDFGKKIAEGDSLAIRSDTHVIEAYLGRGAATGDSYGAKTPAKTEA
ncbi:MAG: ABC transporter ATP-binding protein [Caldilineales bacterium]|nr:ABC transporter ATP-binding protein [Caldilineales bacterium]